MILSLKLLFEGVDMLDALVLKLLLYEGGLLPFGEEFLEEVKGGRTVNEDIIEVGEDDDQATRSGLLPTLLQCPLGSAKFPSRGP